jgi:hypothetical protein
MIYASDAPSRKRLKIVGSAVSRIADSLEVETELSGGKKLLSIYVYYRSDAGEEIPVYCDWGKSWEEDEVYQAIRNMMFVLSFHPRHLDLRSIRRKVCVSA